MKKILLLLFFMLFAGGLFAVYYLIPGILVVSETTKINCVAEGAFRTLSKEYNWVKWWPGKRNIIKTDSGLKFRMNDNYYALSRKSVDKLEVLISDSSHVLSSQLSFLSLPDNTTLIEWRYSANTSKNPFKRIAAYQEAVSLKKDIHNLLNNLQTYLSDSKNIYGFPLYTAINTDTIFISTKSFSKSYPSTDLIYGLIDKLKQFCSVPGCSITGTPILNISPVDSGGYQVMVAVPVNHEMKPGSNIYPKRMPRNKFIVADVQGGPHTIAQAYENIGLYLQDHRKIVMALPFEYLITDRQKEKDTSKWLTKVYAPGN